MITSFYGKKLVAKLKEDLGVDVPKKARIQRTSAGRHQKAAGSWVWYINCEFTDVGSSWPVRQCASSKVKLVMGAHGDITPEDM